MANSGSVFAKQFAGRIRQVGRDGDVSQNSALPKSSSSGANTKAQISAPPAGRQKAASVGVPAAKAKAKAAQHKAGPTGANGEEEEEDGGGVMTCANRGLLQQMLMNANKSDDSLGDVGTGSDDEKSGALSMSMRLVPGTPKAGTQRRAANVPTITSPSSSRASQGGIGVQRAVSSVSVSSHMPKSSSSSSAPSLQAKAKVITATGPPAKTGMPAPVPKIITGAPRPQNIAPAPPRPGSRGGLTGGNPPSQTIISPSHQIGSSSGRGSVSTPSGSYAGIHATRAKASPGVRMNSPPTKAAMTAGRPLCGPSAFDMLRKMENAQTLNCEEEDRGGVEANYDSGGEDGGFIMPAGSDASSLDGDPHARLAEVEQPRLVSESTSRGTAKDNTRKNVSVDAVESAADYVERVKRNMGVPIPANITDNSSKSETDEAAPNEKSQAPSSTNHIGESGRSREQGVPKQPVRARSSDSRTGVSASKGPQASSVVRAQSSDARTVSASRQEEKPPENATVEEDSDDDLPASNSVQWKFDLKSMVKDFAREERARQVNGPTKVSAKAPAPNRPPKAPPPHGTPPHAHHAEKPSTSAHEQIPAGEQLFFSKKPREVDYTPATMDEYKQKGYGKKEYTELKPTLGPDLDDEELLHKKAIQQRNKEFSKELQKINKHRLEAAAKQAPKGESKPESKPTARAKAQEYVRNVPKPKAPIAKPPPERKPKEANSNPMDGKKEDLADWEEIRRREKQHFTDVLRVKEIKEFLGQLNY